MAKSAKPTQPPSGADFSALTKKVNELAAKVGIKPLGEAATGRIPAWKRWVGGETEFDGSGLRDVVNANAVMLDAVKGDLDNLTTATTTKLSNHENRLDALEAAPRPFLSGPG